METEGSPIKTITYSKRSFRASFAADPELWSRFKTECKMRGVSICHVMEVLMEGWIQGQKVMSTVVQPVHMEIHMEHVVKRPRRMKKVKEPWKIARSQKWPPGCEHVDEFMRAQKLIGCKDLKEWIPLEKCWRCFIAKG